MNKRRKTTLTKYLSASVVSGAMVWFYVSVRDIELLPRVDQYRILCDAFTVPGLVLILVGVLIWIAGTGTLDGLTYVLNGLKRMLIPGAGLEKGERFGDYVERKRQKRASGYGFLFVVGGVCMAIALVFMVLFYSIYEK